MPTQYLTASDIRFSDDIHVHSQPLFDVEEVVGSECVKGKSGDHRDKFLISRLNDETSYFYKWFCKRFQFKLKCNQRSEISCPICLESELNSIELQCGHSFCRNCLTLSAEMKISACPMCRADIVLNPVELKQKFEQKRIRNLMRRLQSVEHPTCLGEMPWPDEMKEEYSPHLQYDKSSRAFAMGRFESVDFTTVSHIQPANSKQQVALVSKKHSDPMMNFNLNLNLFNRDVGEMNLNEMQSIFVESMCFLQNQNRDVGGFTRAQVLANANETFYQTLSTSASSVGCNSLGLLKASISVDDESVGALAVSELTQSWNKLLFQDKHLHKSEVCYYPEDGVGGLPIHVVASKWSYNLADCTVGAAETCTIAQRFKTWNYETKHDQTALAPRNLGLSTFEPDVGACGCDELRKRWRCLQQQFGTRDIGDMALSALEQRWNAFANMQVDGRASIGGFSLMSLERRLKDNYGEDVGAVTQARLGKRLKLLSPGLGLSTGDFSSYLLKDSWIAAFEFDLGSLSSNILMNNWQSVKQFGEQFSQEVGNEDLKSLQEHWIGVFEDVGDESISSLSKRWNDLKIADGEDVGSCTTQQFSDRLALSGDVGDHSLKVMNRCWHHLEQLSLQSSQDVGAEGLEDLRAKWKNPSRDVGGESLPTGSERWKALTPFGEDAGSCSTLQLSDRWCMGEDVGSDHVAVLGKNWKTVTRLSERADVGELPQSEVAHRWRNTQDVGATPIVELSIQWDSLQKLSLDGLADVGGSSIDVLQQRTVSVRV
mmetsp:Transcript_21705/g.28099  ORF Transcript_21705/g.28099 Transcript_21705/m.28099 type:complete len:769 (-) Transcript_21705:341-2647(-)